MKQVIRLNENDIRRMVMEALNEIHIPLETFQTMGDKAAQQTDELMGSTGFMKPDNKQYEPTLQKALRKRGQEERFNNRKTEYNGPEQVNQPEQEINEPEPEGTGITYPDPTPKDNKIIQNYIQQLGIKKFRNIDKQRSMVGYSFTENSLIEICKMWRNECAQKGLLTDSDKYINNGDDELENDGDLLQDVMDDDETNVNGENAANNDNQDAQAQNIDNKDNITKQFQIGAPQDYVTPAYYALVYMITNNLDAVKNKTFGVRANGTTTSVLDGILPTVINLSTKQNLFNLDTHFQPITPEEYEQLPPTEQTNWHMSKKGRNAGKYLRYTRKENMNFDKSDPKVVDTIRTMMSDAIQCSFTTGVIEGTNFHLKPVIDVAGWILNCSNPFNRLKQHLILVCTKYISKYAKNEMSLRDTISASEDGSSEGAYRLDQGLMSKKSTNYIANAKFALRGLKSAFEWLAVKNIASYISPEEYAQLKKTNKEEASHYTIIDYEGQLDDEGNAVQGDDIIVDYEDDGTPIRGIKVIAGYIEPEIDMRQFDANGNVVKGNDNKVKYLTNKISDQVMYDVCNFIYENFDSIFKPRTIEVLAQKASADVQDENSDSQFMKYFKRYVNAVCIQNKIMSLAVAKNFWGVFDKIQDQFRSNASNFVNHRVGRDVFEARQRKMINRIVNETIKRHLKKL